MAGKDAKVAEVGPELVLGLVGPSGVDIDRVQELLVDCLKEVGYTSGIVRLTEWLREHVLAGVPAIAALDEHINTFQDAGNKLREQLGRGDSMARVAVDMIRAARESLTNSAHPFVNRHAYIVRQLKHPEEVDELRRVYGSAFYLIGMYEEESQRLSRLTQAIVRSRTALTRKGEYGDAARRLINRDMSEADDFGQNVRDTFPLADFFVHTKDEHIMRHELQRFIELIFGNDLRTPQLEEYLMFQARAVALRSADLSRQVGAVIASEDGSVIAVGMNDVPRAGGRWFIDGQSPDMRDCRFDADQSTLLKHEALGEILDRLREAKLLVEGSEKRDEHSFLKSVARIMKGTRFMGIGEFGRVVHAEMAALLDAAKRGVAVKGQILFTTTFPCQNCAKHIIAAGIQVVVYMEPYPKSLTDILYEGLPEYGPMRALDDRPGEDKVYFGTYLGVAPRMYTQLFAMRARRNADGNTIKWGQHPKFPRLLRAQSDPTILERELESVGILNGFQRPENRVS